ncbi:hypothetical protein Spp001_61 [Shewanella phage Spp001]|uniref:Uncharacterized protein n=1 Tax=Shewanella phage Spp001 TaxID=1445859 RepID=W6EKA8_9CAUD|nr:hypothetical protein Spp001_61 [Shewanella phage Spp001]AHJ10569.1 hypothetical protein Spp001_61 [Shewanella phage Spp001]
MRGSRQTEPLVTENDLRLWLASTAQRVAQWPTLALYPEPRGLYEPLSDYA